MYPEHQNQDVRRILNGSKIPLLVSFVALVAATGGKASTILYLGSLFLSIVAIAYLEGSPYSVDAIIGFLWGKTLQCKHDCVVLFGDQIVGPAQKICQHLRPQFQSGPSLQNNQFDFRHPNQSSPVQREKLLLES